MTVIRICAVLSACVSLLMIAVIGDPDLPRNLLDLFELLMIVGGVILLATSVAVMLHVHWARKALVASLLVAALLNVAGLIVLPIVSANSIPSPGSEFVIVVLTTTHVAGFAFVVCLCAYFRSRRVVEEYGS